MKSAADLNESGATTSTSSSKKSRIFHISRSGSRKLLAKKLGTGDLSKSYDNLWDRLFDLYDLPAVEHAEVEEQMEWFINHPDYLDRVQTRAEPFLYNIVRHLEFQGVPGEIALLPVIESAFQPHVVSPANAAGIWQFIPETGRRYGLKQSHHYDGRRDVYASTRAAVKYLKKLHNQFNGDWLLAIAAYNCGEGAVERAVQKNLSKDRPTDFWSLDLPGETRAYVPRLLAVSRLFAGSEHYGINLHQIPNRALYKTVKVQSQLDLALAADVADLSLDELIALNPGFKSHRADVEGGYRLFVPAEKYKTFKEELGRLTEQTAMASGQNDLLDADVLLSDETVIRNKSSGKSKSDNPGKDKKVVSKLTDKSDKKTRSLYLAGKLPQDELPSRIKEEVPTETSVKSSTKANGRSRYLVESGDTLFSIARKTDTDVEQLRKWNNISAKHPIKPGQSLIVLEKDAGKKLSLAKAGAGIKPSQSLRYTVKQGDSLFAISRKFNVSVAELRKWNGSNLEKQFKPGINLTVARDKD
jgi:membrane-bound lytic murein transglycosylase D